MKLYDKNTINEWGWTYSPTTWTYTIPKTWTYKICIRTWYIACWAVWNWMRIDWTNKLYWRT